jgi:hypothetical protein
VLLDSDCFCEDTYINNNHLSALSCVGGDEAVFLRHCELQRNGAPFDDLQGDFPPVNVFTKMCTTDAQFSDVLRKYPWRPKGFDARRQQLSSSSATSLDSLVPAAAAPAAPAVPAVPASATSSAGPDPVSVEEEGEGEGEGYWEDRADRSGSCSVSVSDSGNNDNDVDYVEVGGSSKKRVRL